MYWQSEFRKNLWNSSVLPMPAQYGKLRPTNGWDWFGSLGHPSKFRWFCVLPSLLQRRRLPEANQTLHDLWPSPVLVHYIYIFGGSFAYIGSVTARHFSSVHQPTLRCHTRNGIMELSQRVPPVFGRVHLASAHILVMISFELVSLVNSILSLWLSFMWLAE